MIPPDADALAWGRARYLDLEAHWRDVQRGRAIHGEVPWLHPKCDRCGQWEYQGHAPDCPYAILLQRDTTEV